MVPATTAGATAAVHREYLLLPSARSPRLLVPRGRRAATGAVRGYGVGRGRSARWQAAALAVGMATGLAPLVLRDRVRVVQHQGTAAGETIESHLSDVLGTDVLLSMYLGAPRANRKPVLQVLDATGRTLAYVKIGVDPLTRALVRDEGDALTALAAADLRRPEAALPGRGPRRQADRRCSQPRPAPNARRNQPRHAVGRDGFPERKSHHHHAR